MAISSLPLDAAAPFSPQAAWHVRMLGALVATPVGLPSGGSDARKCPPVETFRTHKAALLLARLALFSQRAHGREELADLLWPDLPPERGRANLTLTLLYLRQAFDEPRKDGLFIADHKTIRIAKSLLQTDVALWETRAAHALKVSDAPETSALLRESLAAYTGDLLPGFYEDWVCDERNRLSALRDTLLDRLQTLQNLPATLETSASSLQQTSNAPVGKPPPIVNAPLYLTRFFGRTSECERAAHLLCQDPPARLLTLLGTGGIGKTRLSLQIAQAVLQAGQGQSGGPLARFGWAAFVPLAEARTAAHMEGILLRVLEIQSANTDSLTAVVHYLNNRAASCDANRLLLLLDNLEQMAEASASVVARLLAEVPSLTILATSRQPIGIAGEQEQIIGSLRGATRSASASKDMPDDVRLFLDRARLVRPDLESSPEIVEDIVHLCTLLEGIPLALELAATWTRVLSPPQIIARLDQRLDLLSLRGTSNATGTNLPPRHRSLYAAISWSYDLLEPPLRTFFAQLSVFRGGWTAEAAQAVIDVPDADESLLLLAERSLIIVEGGVGEACPSPRYRMLETLREFAHAQLNAPCDARERERLSLRHAAYFDSLSHQADSLAQVQSRVARALLQTERDNLRAAIVFGLQQTSQGAEETEVSRTTEAAERLIRSVRIFLQSSWLCTLKEADHLCNLCGAAISLLPNEARHRIEADFLLVWGTNSTYLGDHEAAQRHLRASLALCEASGNHRGTIRAKGRLANLAFRTDDRARAVAAWWECAAEARRIGDGRLESAMKSNLAVVLPDLEERRMLSEQAVALDRIHAPDSYILASSLNTLGNAAREQTDYGIARLCLEEGYTLACADGSVSTIALLQTSLVELYLETGEQLDRAGGLLRDAQQVLEEIGDLPQVTGVLALRFRLALLQGDAEEALSVACQSLRVSRQIRQDPISIAEQEADVSSQLQRAGFAVHAERWDQFCRSSDGATAGIARQQDRSDR